MITKGAVTSRLKSPIVLFLIAAVLAALVASAAYHYLQQREAAMRDELATKGTSNEVERVAVVVPRVDVEAGVALQGDTFLSRRIEADLVYPDTVLADDFSALEGQKLARPLLRGRPLRLQDLVAPEIRDVATILPPGRRAVTIDIDNVNSIAQTLRPNHRIDIFLLTKAPSRTIGGAGNATEQELEHATLYMQDMVVLATGIDFYDVSKPPGDDASKMVRPGDIQGRDKGYDTVTLLVTPAEAAKLMLGQKMGSFRIALRGQQDHGAIARTSFRGSDMLPGYARRTTGIEFIVGGNSGSMVSELAVPPSMLPPSVASATQARRSRSDGRPEAVPEAVPDANKQSITITMPASRAGRSASGEN